MSAVELESRVSIADGYFNWFKCEWFEAVAYYRAIGGF